MLEGKGQEAASGNEDGTSHVTPLRIGFFPQLFLIHPLCKAMGTAAPLSSLNGPYSAGMAEALHRADSMLLGHPKCSISINELWCSRGAGHLLYYVTVQAYLWQVSSLWLVQAAVCSRGSLMGRQSAATLARSQMCSRRPVNISLASRARLRLWSAMWQP